MAAKVFDDILLKGIRSGEVPGRTKASREWYRQQARKVSPGRVTEDTLMRQAAKNNRKANFAGPGNMYMFGYDPKHKATLPYYDKFPLIFPLGPAKGGFLGMNLHYLPPVLRAKLMDALYDTISNDKLDNSTRLKISYSKLQSASKFKAFKPTIKHYLYKHVKSNLIYIAPTEWDIALFLPTARFIGAGKNEVYGDSRRIIRGK